MTISPRSRRTTIAVATVLAAVPACMAEQLTGTVVDAVSREGIANAMVQEAGTGNVALTDGRGKFSLEVPALKPNNAVVIMVGDFDSAEMLAKIKAAFGKIARAILLGFLANENRRQAGLERDRGCQRDAAHFEPGKFLRACRQQFGHALCHFPQEIGV